MRTAAAAFCEHGALMAAHIIDERTPRDVAIKWVAEGHGLGTVKIIEEPFPAFGCEEPGRCAAAETDA